MFDIGWSELLLIGIVALIVVGPKELPGLFRTVGQFTGRARAMAREFQRSLEQAADQSGLNEAARGLNAAERFGMKTTGIKPAAPVAKPAPAPIPTPAAESGPVPDPGAPAAPATPSEQTEAAGTGGRAADPSGASPT